MQIQHGLRPVAAQQSDDPLAWPRRFAERHGRPPRVLHVGNVANYAFVNAKLMRRHGVDCAVIDPDFYHIMAAPEWHEAEVEGDPGDHFFPDWRRVALKGYRRPDWFVQGPADLTYRLIELRYQGRRLAAALLLRVIEAYRLSLCRKDKAWVHRIIASSHPLAIWAKDTARRLLANRGGTPAASPPVVAPEASPAAAAEPDEFTYLRAKAALYAPAFRHFDVIQGYTIGAMYPALLGLPNYTAYELGTLRGLPFEDSTIGRLTAHIYRSAPFVFVTNVDCVDAAHRLGIQDDHMDAVLHAFDLDAAVEFSARHRPSVEASPFFFAPARHHWKDGNASWLKGNHVIIQAAGLAARRGARFRLRFVEWGAELELSRALIAEEGIADRVEWIAPQCRLRLWPHYLDSVAVVDQFNAQAFGGVALEAMALGKRLLTRFDMAASRRFFSTEPPIINVETPEALAAAMQAALDDAADRAGIGAAAQDWMLREHSTERQMRQQFAAYAALTGC